MKKHIAFAVFGLSSLLFIAGSAEAGCRSRGWWGYSQAPAYQTYSYSAPAPATPGPAATAAQSGNSYRSFSYEPGTAQPSYQYYAPRSYNTAPRGADDFRANRKMFGLQN